MGVSAVKKTIQAALDRGVEVLTLFAFSSENWRRPAVEVGVLMELFLATLKRELKRLHSNGVRVRFLGDLSRFPKKLQDLMESTVQKTADNSRMTLVIAAGYGGRWEIAAAARRLAEQVQRGEIGPEAVDEAALTAQLQFPDLPEPELFIRTSGEQRISNFLLWQAAYTELYFTDILWPDFDAQSLNQAIEWFQQRERRFGKTSEQLGSGVDQC